MNARDMELDANTVMNRALAALLEYREPLVLVDSPPGAGKTWFCERLIGLAMGLKLRVLYVAPKVDQGCDLVRRLLAVKSDLRIDVLVGNSRTQPADLVGRVGWSSDPTAVGTNLRLVVSNPSKLALHRDPLHSGHFDLLVIDEAYQIAAKDMWPIADLAPVVVMVGDPGQLPPTIVVETSEFEDAGSHVHWAAPREVLRLHPGIPVFQLPASRRLVEDTVRIVQPAFYPHLEFRSAARCENRRLLFDAAGMGDPIDRALDLLQRGASVVGLLLPGEPPATDERDPDVENLIARAIDRMLKRGARWVPNRRLQRHDFGVVDSHVLSGGAVRARLQEHGLADVAVATPELWQGRESPVMFVKHPLNVGRASPAAFDLDPGRFCVMLSRHQLACIVVGRESIQTRLDNYMHDSRHTPIGAPDVVWSGYKAHSTVWRILRDENRLIRAYEREASALNV
jgi:hypothetical protein